MATKDPREPFTRIDVKEADDMMKDGAEVVDVREPHEYTAGHVPGAKLIPVNSVYARREELPRDKNLIFVCAVGQRSALACELAAAAGLGMNLAFEEMFGISDGFANVEFSGRTDLYILSEGLRQHGISGGHAAYMQGFLRSYHHHLSRTLMERKGHLEPGFPQLLEALRRRDGVRIGLATGNFSEAAWMKLEHYGIRDYFFD